jgi:ring-1,2-phenylacetyl-CoA epoxidase subunit PaaE
MSHELIPAKIYSIDKATPKIKIFRIWHGRKDFSFKPGQWIDLYAPLPSEKNIGGYTIISSAHTQEYFDLAIRESLHHPVTKFLHQAEVGTEVQVTMGQGKFFLSDEMMQEKALTFIAGGIGVTPILSMIRSLDKTKTAVKLFYSVSNEEDILFKDELKAFSVFSVTKKTTPEWPGETQRISVELLKKYKADLKSHFFICGPKEMINILNTDLKIHGVPPTHIHFEKWW